MAAPSQRLLSIALIAGLVLGVGGTAAAIGIASPAPPGDGAARVINRESVERALAEASIKPTGQLRRFELTVAETDWEILPGVVARAIAFNGTVPGPTIRVTEGDTVEIAVRNELDIATSVHWHGLHVPNDQDGVAGVTQSAIAPGDTFQYRFVAPHAGTFMYHTHGPASREQIDRGLYAPFIIDPAAGDPIRPDVDVTLALQGWMIGDDMGGMSGMSGMSMEYNYFTINGKAFPATSSIDVNEGDLVRVRFINPSQTIHPMHLHGTDMAVIAKDGEQLSEPQRLNTLDIAQGETYEVVFRADNPGAWLLHCHDLHHASNNGQEPGGLVVVINVRPNAAPGAPAPTVAGPSPAPSVTADPGMTEMPGMSH